MPEFVSPRFTDSTLEDPLPLVEHFEDLFLSSSARPVQLFIEGARGSGLTTTLERLAAIAAEAEAAGRGRAVVRASHLLGVGSALVRGQLERGEAILFLDLSITPLESDDRRVVKVLPALTEHGDWLRRCWLVVATRDASPLERWTANTGEGGEIAPHPLRVRLAPWGRDELIALLGACPESREHRARLIPWLARLPRGRALLERPRTARWIVDAALELPPEVEPTLAALYANFLDTLPLDAIQSIRERTRGEAGRARVRALLEARPSLARELAVLVEGAPGRPAPDGARPAGTLAGTSASPGAPGTTSLALPGLDHFLLAGDVIAAIAAGRAPEQVVERGCLPFIREMLTPGLQETLRGWLNAPEPIVRCDTTAVTLLLAAGALPRITARATPRILKGALLEDADLAGASLEGAAFDDASLARTRFDGAALAGAGFKSVRAASASFERANLEQATFWRADLTQARFTDARLRGARFTATDLSGAHLEGADLPEAEILSGTLAGADMSNANLAGAQLSAVQLRATDLTGASLENARLRGLDLRATCLAAARLAGAQIARCLLVGVDLGDVLARFVHFERCDLTGALLRGDFNGATFRGCRAHEIVFTNADLRQAAFEGVSFHAGSSRAGLLLGRPALEGNKTGYYVEGTTDDEWASPDSIRQATFRDCDLRGARFLGTNLFRVDFRGSRLDAGLRHAASAQGAIID